MHRKIFLGIIAGLLSCNIALAQSVQSKIEFTRILRKGINGEDVKQLQNFLKSLPDIYPSGLVTGYFGPLTETAVQRLQEKQGIVKEGDALSTGFGQVGPRTAAKINELIMAGAGSSGIIPPGPVSSANPQPPQPGPTSLLPADSSTWQTITDPTYGYVVSYPPTWKLLDSQKSSGSPVNDYEQRLVGSPEKGSAAFAFIIRVYYDKNTLTTQDWYEKVLKGTQFPQFYPTPVLATTSITMAGLPGVRASASFNGFTFREYFVAKNNFVYAVYLTNNDYTLSGDIEIANTILSRFVIP